MRDRNWGDNTVLRTKGHSVKWVNWTVSGWDVKTRHGCNLLPCSSSHLVILPRRAWLISQLESIDTWTYKEAITRGTFPIGLWWYPRLCVMFPIWFTIVNTSLYSICSHLNSPKHQWRHADAYLCRTCDRSLLIVRALCSNHTDSDGSRNSIDHQGPWKFSKFTSLIAEAPYTRKSTFPTIYQSVLISVPKSRARLHNIHLGYRRA